MDAEENVCCPFIAILECGDSEEHAHLICNYVRKLYPNKHIIETCINNFKECIHYKEVLG